MSLCFFLFTTYCLDMAFMASRLMLTSELEMLDINWSLIFETVWVILCNVYKQSATITVMHIFYVSFCIFLWSLPRSDDLALVCVFLEYLFFVYEADIPIKQRDALEKELGIGGPILYQHWIRFITEVTVKIKTHICSSFFKIIDTLGTIIHCIIVNYRNAAAKGHRTLKKCCIYLCKTVIYKPHRCLGNLTDVDADDILHFLHAKKGQSLLLQVMETTAQKIITTAMYSSYEITSPDQSQPRNRNHAEKQLCEDKASLKDEIQDKCNASANLEFQMFMNNSPCKLCSTDLKSLLEELSKELFHRSIEISVRYIWPYGLEKDKKGLLKMIGHSPGRTNRVSISNFSWVQFYDVLFSHISSRPHHKNSKSWVLPIMYDIMSEEEKSELIVSYLYQKTHQRAVKVTMDVTHKTHDWNARNIFFRRHVGQA